MPFTVYGSFLHVPHSSLIGETTLDVANMQIVVLAIYMPLSLILVDLV